MIRADKIIIGGVEINGSDPIDPVKKSYVERHGGELKQSTDGKVILTGQFFFTAENFNEFVNEATQETSDASDKKIAEKNDVHNVNFGFTKGFLTQDTKQQSSESKPENNKANKPKPASGWKKGFLL